MFFSAGVDPGAKRRAAAQANLEAVGGGSPAKVRRGAPEFLGHFVAAGQRYVELIVQCLTGPQWYQKFFESELMDTERVFFKEGSDQIREGQLALCPTTKISIRNLTRTTDDFTPPERWVQTAEKTGIQHGLVVKIHNAAHAEALETVLEEFAKAYKGKYTQETLLEDVLRPAHIRSITIVPMHVGDTRVWKFTGETYDIHQQIKRAIPQERDIPGTVIQYGFSNDSGEPAWIVPEEAGPKLKKYAEINYLL